MFIIATWNKDCAFTRHIIGNLDIFTRILTMYVYLIEAIQYFNMVIIFLQAVEI